MNNKITIWLLLIISLLQAYTIVYLIKERDSYITTPQQPLNNSSRAISNQSNLSPTNSDTDLILVSSANTNQQSATISADTIRNTIRQELASYFEAREQSVAENKQLKPQSNHISAPLEIERVNQQLDLMIANGSMSNDSFESFSYNVSKLASADRRVALSRLAKAINSGQIKPTN
jgi:hypothetical protein